jgi:dTDP-4-dehydrorhamnose 3,5-epimerase
MPIKVEETEISDVKIIRGNRFIDERGFFSETYKESEYLEIGIPRFVQDNMSESSKGVIRGLHWQNSPHGQGKLVTCLRGSILDVAVDIRRESQTFGKHVAIELNAKEQIALWVPEGFAHGFQSLENQTRVSYKVTNYWDKTSERSLIYNDSTISILWRNLDPIVSIKDLEAPTFNELHWG